MGQKFLAFGQVEARRLLWIVSLLFALIAALQYFELPYISFLSSLTSVEKVSGQGNNRDSNYIVPEMIPGKRNQTRNSSLGDDRSRDKDTLSLIFIEPNSTSEPENFDYVNDNGISKERARAPELSFNGNTSSIYNNSSTSTVENETTSRSENVNNAADDGFSSEEVREKELRFNGNISTIYNDSSTSTIGNVTTVTSFNNTWFSSPPPVTSPVPASSPSRTAESVLDRNTSIPSAISGIANSSFVDKERSNDSKKAMLDVYTLSDMNDLLVQSRDSYYSTMPRWSTVADGEIQEAMFQIENAPIVKQDQGLYAPLYRNVSRFKRSYELMEKILKVYIYKEGDRPILHTPVLKGLYASEGWFMKQLESNKIFITKNPGKAHLFYIPFSSRMLEEALYVVGSHSHKNLIKYLKNYRDLIAGKYPYWNRTGGADHFVAACHDWAPSETRTIMEKSIRALCNSDVKEGFVFGKDVSLPETYVQLPKNPVRDIGGKPASKRTILAFFAGSMHGYLRPILLQHWQDKDPDMKIFGRLPKKSKASKNTYSSYMKSSKYCICAKGYEVNSPRVVEALLYECVPVIVSDNFVPPFFAVLNWESFAVFVAEKDVPDLKKILQAIPEESYSRLQMNVKKVQRHFLWHAKPEKYDIFHMILHSVWYNRLHQIRPTQPMRKEEPVDRGSTGNRF